MSFSEYIFLVITISGIVTWLSRVLPFVILKKLKLSHYVLEYLSFVPVVIMSALWFSNLFTQHLGSLPSINMNNFLASIPTVLTVIITKKLFFTVIVGIISLGLIQLL